MVAQAIGMISPVLENFDVENGVGSHSTVRKEVKSEKDMKCLVSELMTAGVFNSSPGRHHSSFRNPRIPLHAKSEEEMLDWMKKRIHFS